MTRANANANVNVNGRARANKRFLHIPSYVTLET